MKERLQKFLSTAGVASRRQAEQLILSGEVFLNDQKAVLGDRVDPLQDIVKVKGIIVQASSEKIYLILNKPKGYWVSKYDPHAPRQKTVFDLLPPDLRNKVWAIGRLDVDTEGLLILTNDGELTQELAHPKYEHEKEYEVITNENPTEAQLEQLQKGVKIPTGLTYPAKINTENNKIYITIHEGKKRQIRHMFKTVGLTILNLKRIRINQLQLPEDLKMGEFKRVSVIAKSDSRMAI
jgi:23S rRNA pseudouridine2605 synthase